MGTEDQSLHDYISYHVSHGLKGMLLFSNFLINPKPKERASTEFNSRRHIRDYAIHFKDKKNLVTCLLCNIVEGRAEPRTQAFQFLIHNLLTAKSSHH